MPIPTPSIDHVAPQALASRLSKLRQQLRQIADAAPDAPPVGDVHDICAALEKIEDQVQLLLPARALIDDGASWYHPDQAPEWENLFANRCIDKLISDYQFTTVLDIGAGRGKHSRVFAQFNKAVTAVDIADFGIAQDNIEFINSHFDTFTTERTFDCIWCSHVLEHQPNPHNFLCKLHDLLSDNGVLAITVPPLKDQIVGGHVTLWNAGVILYQLALAGFDCSQAAILAYGYNISIILNKTSIRSQLTEMELYYDQGDIIKLSPFLPEAFREEGFNGNISHHNWFAKK